MLMLFENWANKAVAVTSLFDVIITFVIDNRVNERDWKLPRGRSNNAIDCIVAKQKNC